MMYTGKQLRALVMPLMFEQFLNVMVGMVDTLMVSKAGEAGYPAWHLRLILIY